MLSGILGVLIFLADVYAIVQVFQSRESTGSKLLWTLLILVLPVLGLVVWYFAGPKAASG